MLDTMTSFRLDRARVQKLDELSELAGLSRGGVIRLLIDAAAAQPARVQKLDVKREASSSMTIKEGRKRR